MSWLSSGEPTLEEMLADQTVITLMERDSVDPDGLRVLVREMSRRLTRDLPSDAAGAQPASSRVWEVQRLTPARVPASDASRWERQPVSRPPRVRACVDGAATER